MVVPVVLPHVAGHVVPNRHGHIDAGLRGFRVLTGAEVNIRKDGTLDIADEALAELDVVGIGIHHHFSLPREEMTRRVIRAMENPHADIFFHPTARSGRRPAVDLDMEAVIEAAIRTGTVLEINAQPDRLDLKDEHAWHAVAAGARVAIDSDAHHVRDFEFLRDMGIPAARRAWVRAEDCVNAREVEAFLACLKDRPAS